MVNGNSEGEWGRGELIGRCSKTLRNGNSGGRGGGGVGGVLSEKPSLGEVWIFSGITHCTS